MLVKQIHSLVKTKLQVKTLHILKPKHGQPHTTKLPRRLIPHHRRTDTVPRPRPNSRPSYLQPSPLPLNYHTYRQTNSQHSQCASNRTSLNNSSSHSPNCTCPAIPANLISDRRSQRTRHDLKSYWTSMILNLRIHRLQKPNIRLLHNTYIRPTHRPLPTTRSRPPGHCTHKLHRPSHRHCQRRTTLVSCTKPRCKNRRNSRTPKSNLIPSLTPRGILRPMLRNLRSKPQLHAYRSGIYPSRQLRKLIFPTIILTIKKLWNSTSLLS